VDERESDCGHGEHYRNKHGEWRRADFGEQGGDGWRIVSVTVPAGSVFPGE